MRKHYLLGGLILGFLSIILGAFGAHGLETIISESKVESFKVGVRYQMYHALLLIAISQINYLDSKLVFYLIVIGVTLFSGSIYLLNLNEYLNIPAIKYLGPITPLGGLILLSAWFIMIRLVIRKK